MVAAIFGIFFGMSASPFAVILKPLMVEFNSGRGPVSIMLMILFLGAGIAAFFVSRFPENHRPQKFILWGTVIGCVTILLSSLANSLWQMYIAYFIIGVAQNGCAGAVTIIILLSKWFKRKRGQAVGIGFAGMALGSLIITPVIGLILEHFGWRATYLFAGLLLLVINIPLILLVLRYNPEDLGLLPDGDKAIPVTNTYQPTTSQIESPKPKTKLVFYLKTIPLWLICMGFPLTALGGAAISQHEVSFITDMGISTALAASALGFTGAIGGLSGLAAGWLADRLGPRYVTMLFFGIVLVSIFILMRTNTMSMVWLFVVIYGLGSGASGPLLPLITAEIFGPAGFNKTFGFINIFYYCGIAFGAPLAGFIFDATDSYLGVFIIVAIFYVVAMAATYLAYGIKPRFKPKYY
jgi:MFS family permease